MNIQLVFQALSLVNAAVGAVIAHREGSPAGALEILNALDPRALGLSDDVADAVILSQAALGYLEARGVARHSAFAAILAHRESGMPLTAADVEAYLVAHVDPALADLDAAIKQAQAEGR